MLRQKEFFSVEEFDDIQFNFDSKTQNKLKKKMMKKERKIQSVENSLRQFNLKSISPKTKNQTIAFEEYFQEKNLLLHGVAGTGKTFISLYLALNDILKGEGDKKRVVIVRSVVPTRDMGFLPGTQAEKTAVYEQPYMSICNELFGRDDAYGILKQKGVIDFISTSFIRGLTLNDSIVIVDECQNMNFHELDSVITRFGENSRVCFCGDFRQSDLIRQSEKEGINTFMRVIGHMPSFGSVEFQKEDIVRSPLVKEYILSKLDEGIV